MNLYLNVFILTALLLWPLVSAIIKKKDIFNPINFLSLMALIGYLIPAAIMLDNPDVSGYRNLDGFVITNQLITEALLITNICIVAIYCGFYVKIGIVNRKSALNYSAVYSSSRVMMLYIIMVSIAIGSNILMYSLLGAREVRGVGYEFGYGYLQPLTALGFTAFAFYFSFYHYSSVKNKYSTVLQLSAFALAAFSFATSGSRGGVLAYLMVFILSRHYLYKRINVVKVFVLFVILFILVIYLGLGRFSESAGVSLLDIATVLYLQTFAGLESLMVVINRIPADIDYYYGALGFAANTYPFFPRSLFPGKPTVYGYDLFWEDYIGLITVGQTQQFLSLPGQFYADFGLLGVVFGSLITGILLKEIYSYFCRNIRDPGVVLIYLLFATIVLQGLVFGAPNAYILIQSFLLPLLGLRWARKNKIVNNAIVLAVR